MAVHVGERARAPTAAGCATRCRSPRSPAGRRRGRRPCRGAAGRCTGWIVWSDSAATSERPGLRGVGVWQDAQPISSNTSAPRRTSGVLVRPASPAPTGSGCRTSPLPSRAVGDLRLAAVRRGGARRLLGWAVLLGMQRRGDADVADERAGGLRLDGRLRWPSSRTGRARSRRCAGFHTRFGRPEMPSPSASSGSASGDDRRLRHRLEQAHADDLRGEPRRHHARRRRSDRTPDRRSHRSATAARTGCRRRTPRRPACRSPAIVPSVGTPRIALSCSWPPYTGSPARARRAASVPGTDRRSSSPRAAVVARLGRHPPPVEDVARGAGAGR